MASEAKSILREQIEDRHGIFSRNLAEKFQNLSLDGLAQAGLLDIQQLRLKAVWWVVSFDKQLCVKIKEAATFLPICGIHFQHQ